MLLDKTAPNQHGSAPSIAEYWGRALRADLSGMTTAQFAILNEGIGKLALESTHAYVATLIASNVKVAKAKGQDSNPERVGDRGIVAACTFIACSGEFLRTGDKRKIRTLGEVVSDCGGVFRNAKSVVKYINATLPKLESIAHMQDIYLVQRNARLLIRMIKRDESMMKAIDEKAPNITREAWKLLEIAKEKGFVFGKEPLMESAGKAVAIALEKNGLDAAHEIIAKRAKLSDVKEFADHLEAFRLFLGIDGMDWSKITDAAAKDR